MNVDVGHLHFGDHILAQYPDLGRPQGTNVGEMTMIQEDSNDAVIPQAGPQHPCAEVLVETEGEGIRDVVIIELDPLHLQIPLAHVPLEDIEEGVLPLSHPVA